MKSIFAFLMLVSLSITVFAQEKSEQELWSLYASNQSNKDIEEYAANPKELTALSLYYVGVLCFDREDYKSALKYVNFSLGKDSSNAKAFHLKASTLFNLQQKDEAIRNYKTAIKLRPGKAWYYSDLGDCYYSMKEYDLALKTYIEATELKDSMDIPYYMLAFTYSVLYNNDKALENFYKAKPTLGVGSPDYNNTLFNIGLLELMKGNNDKAESAFIELVQLDSTFVMKKLKGDISSTISIRLNDTIHYEDLKEEVEGILRKISFERQNQNFQHKN